MQQRALSHAVCRMQSASPAKNGGILPCVSGGALPLQGQEKQEGGCALQAQEVGHFTAVLQQCTILLSVVGNHAVVLVYRRKRDRRDASLEVEDGGRKSSKSKKRAQDGQA